MAEYNYISRWALPANYCGEIWPDYYSAGAGQHRDSDTLSRSNFAAMLSDLGGESETVIVVRESHFLVGWVEWIAIHESDTKALQIANHNCQRLEDYPVLDEDAWIELEYEEASVYWNNLSPRDKVQYAMDIRERFHWLATAPVWIYGRMDYSTMINCDNVLTQAIEESLRNN